ncbi:hypothetical protein BYT27DRAFT_7154304 [Phlegmacium glaucopus]|nr:hypothetical protein BYT27DRAFT_7154304 [Phlegmacium glaucopus]
MTRKRLKGPATTSATPQTPLDTQAVNTSGFPALADEIYLEIISHIPSVPIPTPLGSPSHPKIRRSRHETLLSLSQTCRSLRRVFLRYLWQRIEVREGMKVGDKNDTLVNPSSLNYHRAIKKPLQKYTVELVRQLEIVTIRNPQLAQYVNYVDIFIGEYSFNTVLAELARCLSLFSNLHTIQVDVTLCSKRALEKAFERTFKKYSYPQIRNVFVMYLSESLLGSCPEARRIGFTLGWTIPGSFLHRIVDNCRRLEVFEDFAGLICKDDTCKFVVENFPNLRHITVSPSTELEHNSPIDVLTKLNQLQSITLIWKQSLMAHTLDRSERYSARWKLSICLEPAKEVWTDRAKRILLAVQLRDKLEKYLTVLTKNNEGEEVAQTITLKPFEDSREALALISMLTCSP